MNGRLNTQAGFQRIIEIADGDAAHDAPLPAVMRL
jgi:hypothetical protein